MMTLVFEIERDPEPDLDELDLYEAALDLLVEGCYETGKWRREYLCAKDASYGGGPGLP